MNKMREAFDEWFGQDGGSIGNPVRYQTFKAGYQAAIADVKAGRGYLVWLHDDGTIASALTGAPNTHLNTLYKLEDV